MKKILLSIALGAALTIPSATVARAATNFSFQVSPDDTNYATVPDGTGVFNGVLPKDDGGATNIPFNVVGIGTTTKTFVFQAPESWICSGPVCGMEHFLYVKWGSLESGSIVNDRDCHGAPAHVVANLALDVVADGCGSMSFGGPPNQGSYQWTIKLTGPAPTPAPTPTPTNTPPPTPTPTDTPTPAPIPPKVAPTGCSPKTGVPQYWDWTITLTGPAASYAFDVSPEGPNNWTPQPAGVLTGNTSVAHYQTPPGIDQIYARWQGNVTGPVNRDGDPTDCFPHGQSPTPAPTPTPTPVVTPPPTPTPVVTPTATPTPGSTPSPTARPTPTLKPGQTPIPTPRPTPTPKPGSVATTPGSSPSAAGSAGPSGSASLAALSPGASPAPTASPAESAVVPTATSGGPDLTLLILAGVLLLCLLMLTPEIRRTIRKRRNRA